MFLKTVSTIARISLLVLPAVALTAVNCGGGGSGGAAGSTGTAGTGGSTGTGGTGGGGGGGVAKCDVVSPTAADVSIMDWENVMAGATTSSFLMYMDGTYGGGTFEYPSASPCDQTVDLCPNFDGKNWHIKGTVHDYSGFGIYFNKGVVWDVSMFTGISFDISGTFGMAAGVDAGTVPTASVTFGVTDLPHEVDSAHTADGRLTCGTCVPSAGNEYDGSCVAPTKAITLTSTPVTTALHWIDISGGRRPPNFSGESPNPAMVSHISWVLPWGGPGSTPYTVDLVIDNLKYLTN